MCKMGRMLIEGSTDMNQTAWDFKMYCLNKIVKDKNPTGKWKVIGTNLGWNKNTGSKYFEAFIGSTLMSKILPSNAECSFQIHNFGKGLMIINNHHDAMGEKYYILPIAESTFRKQRNINTTEFLNKLKGGC